MSALFDVKTRKFCAVRIRTKPRHDIQDAKYLLKRTEVQQTFFGVTEYDAKWLRKLCHERKIEAQFKLRKNTNKKNIKKSLLNKGKII